MKKLLLLISLSITSACAHGPYPVSSPYFTIPEGSHLILKQTLTIPADTGRVTIQYDKVITNNNKNLYYPHCWFLSWKLSTSPTLITKDDFVITSSEKNENFVSTQQTFSLASADIGSLSGMTSETMLLEYSTILTIHSEKQPDIRQLICSHWDEAPRGQHLTLSQINKALGKIAQLKLN